MQPSISNARRRKAPRTEPITIPAIAPPDSPLLFPAFEFPADDEDFDVGVEVAIIEDNGGSVDVAATGRTTPEHIFVVFEKTQHESVALGELAEQ